MLYFSCTIGQLDDSCSFVDAAGKADGTQLSDQPRNDVCDELPIQSNSEASKYIAIRDIALSQNEHGADMSIRLDASNHSRPSQLLTIMEEMNTCPRKMMYLTKLAAC